MAVPKKRRSKAKGKTRLAIWKGKGRKVASRALTLAKSVLNKNSKFIFDPKQEDKKEVDDNNIESIVDSNSTEEQ